MRRCSLLSGCGGLGRKSGLRRIPDMGRTSRLCGVSGLSGISGRCRDPGQGRISRICGNFSGDYISWVRGHSEP